MPVYLDGREFANDAEVEAHFNPVIPSALKEAYRMPLESPEKPAGALKSEEATGVALDVSGDPGPSQEVDWSKLNQPFGSVKSTSKEDTPVVATAAGGITITEGDIGQAIDVGMGAGPGIIAGVKARTAKLGRLGTGMDYTDPAVTAKTGWWKGSDGKMKFEISDEGMKLADRDWKYGETGKLSDFVEHPELFKAYPDIADINFKVADKGYKYIGAYNAKDKLLTINTDAIKAGDEGILDVLTHEIQHIIQAKEGFATGSNPDRAAIQAAEAVLKKMSSTKDPEFKKELVDLYIDMTSNKAFAEYMYLRNPGEVEANIVAARRKLSDEMRQKFPVDEHKKIVEGEVNTLHGGKYLPEFIYPEVP